MDYIRRFNRTLLLAAFVGATAFQPAPARAHCDGVDGPVVKAAQHALATGDPKLVLIWVRAVDEPQIRKAFEQALTVRALSPAAKNLADTYFFETVVRVHRAGEGVAFTGLKPAGRDLGPAIPAADQALSTGNPDALLSLLNGRVRAGVLERYRKTAAAASFPAGNVSAGRAYVDDYVRYIHYVEAIYEASASPALGHYPEGATPAR